MKKYVLMLKYELKNIIKDSMTMVLLIYPLLIIGIASYVMPAVLDNYGGETPGTRTAGLVMVILFASIAPFVSAVLLGFGLLDNRDENTLDTIRVTPISLRGYIIFKTVYAYMLSINASFWTIIGTKHLSGDGYTIMGQNLFEQFTVANVIVYALVAGLFTPVFALFLAAFAKNKIEGFALMKSSGMIIILPALVVIQTMQDAKQYLLGIIPIFWPVKGLMTAGGLLEHPSNLPVWLYMIIGIIYMSVLTVMSYKLFEKKVQS